MRGKVPYKNWLIDFKYILITNNTDWLTTAPGGTSLYCLSVTNNTNREIKQISDLINIIICI